MLVASLFGFCLHVCCIFQCLPPIDGSFVARHIICVLLWTTPRTEVATLSRYFYFQLRVFVSVRVCSVDVRPCSSYQAAAQRPSMYPLSTGGEQEQLGGAHFHQQPNLNMIPCCYSTMMAASHFDPSIGARVLDMQAGWPFSVPFEKGTLSWHCRNRGGKWRCSAKLGMPCVSLAQQASQGTTQQWCRQLAHALNYSVKIKLSADPSFTIEYESKGESISAYGSLLKSGYMGGLWDLQEQNRWGSSMKKRVGCSAATWVCKYSGWQWLHLILPVYYGVHCGGQHHRWW